MRVLSALHGMPHFIVFHNSRSHRLLTYVLVKVGGRVYKGVFNKWMAANEEQVLTFVGMSVLLASDCANIHQRTPESRFKVAIFTWVPY